MASGAGAVAGGARIVVNAAKASSLLSQGAWPLACPASAPHARSPPPLLLCPGLQMRPGTDGCCLPRRLSARLFLSMDAGGGRPRRGRQGPGAAGRVQVNGGNLGGGRLLPGMPARLLIEAQRKHSTAQLCAATRSIVCLPTCHFAEHRWWPRASRQTPSRPALSWRRPAARQTPVRRRWGGAVRLPFLSCLALEGKPSLASPPPPFTAATPLHRTLQAAS